MLLVSLRHFRALPLLLSTPVKCAIPTRSPMVTSSSPPHTPPSSSPLRSSQPSLSSTRRLPSLPTIPELDDSDDENRKPVQPSAISGKRKRSSSDASVVEISDSEPLKPAPSMSRMGKKKVKPTNDGRIYITKQTSVSKLIHLTEFPSPCWPVPRPDAHGGDVAFLLDLTDHPHWGKDLTKSMATLLKLTVRLSLSAYFTVAANFMLMWSDVLSGSGGLGRWYGGL